MSQTVHRFTKMQRLPDLLIHQHIFQLFRRKIWDKACI